MWFSSWWDSVTREVRSASHRRDRNRRRHRSPSRRGVEVLEDRTLLSAIPADIDNNNRVDVFTDGILLARRMVGFGGQALTQAAIAGDATRTDDTAVERYLDGLIRTQRLDVDGNGTQDLFTDGILLARRMVGFGGEALIRQALAPDATRNNAAAVEHYLDDLFAEAGLLSLWEADQFVTSSIVQVPVGAVAGRRIVEIDLQAWFDTTDQRPAVEDLFQIYLVDSQNPSQTLLDRGERGTSLFTLAAGRTEMVPGLVRYNGSTVTVDVSSVTGATQGDLVLQLINSDSDSGTRINIDAVHSTVDPQAGSGFAAVAAARRVFDPGPATDRTAWQPATGIDVKVSNVRLDSTTGDYSAEVRLHNVGGATDRRLTVDFEELPNGVTLVNASGTDSAGTPYVNFIDAIPGGGLALGQSSQPVRIQFSDPGLDAFSIIPRVLTGGPNQAPVFESVGTLNVAVGGVLQVPLNATDPDGDRLKFSIRADADLPTGELNQDTLTFRPDSGDEGTYQFALIASDGVVQTEQAVTLIVAPPSGSTSLTGIIQNVDQQPLVGVPIEVGPLQTVTDASGSFTIDVGSSDPFPANVVRVIGTAIAGPDSYPFIAEPIDLLLQRPPIVGANNVIGRPIYLPMLDLAQADTIDPASTTVVDAQLAEDEAPVTVTIAAGTLLDQSGAAFTGQMSITEVPANLTPAALPADLLPSAVITVQPGEMEFTTPAPVTFPNRADYAPGTELDLWSINHETGLFDIVGLMRVSGDGSAIETVSGGIRSSSWHFTVPPRNRNQPDPDSEDRNPDDACPDDCQATGDLTSRVDLFSGAVIETHDLVTYQSVGQTRGLRLVYDSLRADPRPIVHFGLRNPDPSAVGLLGGRLFLKRGDFVTLEAGGGLNLQEFAFPFTVRAVVPNFHYWRVRQATQTPPEVIRAAIQADLSGQPSGVYEYQLDFGTFQPTLTNFGSTVEHSYEGNTVTTTGELVSVNEIGSSLGSGWGIAGLQKLIENPNGSILLIDGDGGEMVFDPPSEDGQPWTPPPEDFSVLERLPDGTFRRTMPNQTVYQFDDLNRLAEVTDRNSLSTTYEYDAQGRLTMVTDPVGLQTSLEYLTNQPDDQNQPTVMQIRITDPAARVTQLSLSGPGTQVRDSNGTLHPLPAGKLFRIADPDGSSRTFLYDGLGHLTDEFDKRGHREQTQYGFHGRAEAAVRKDGSTIAVSPIAVDGLFPPEQTDPPVGHASPLSALQQFREAVPTAVVPSDVVSTYVDANGNLTELQLNRAGELVTAFDGLAQLPEVIRNDNNQITTVIDANSNETRYTYDDRGNLSSIIEGIQVNSWVGTDGGDWHTATNWSTGEVPGTTDIATIDGAEATSINISSDVTVAGLRLSGGGKRFDLRSATLTVAEPIQLSSQDIILLKDSTIVANVINQGLIATFAGSVTSRISGTVDNQRGALLHSEWGTLILEQGLTNSGETRLGGADNNRRAELTVTGGILLNTETGLVDVHAGASSANSPLKLNADIDNRGQLLLNSFLSVLQINANTILNTGTIADGRNTSNVFQRGALTINLIGSNARFINSGMLRVLALFTINGGTTEFAGGQLDLINQFRINNATLTGAADIVIAEQQAGIIPGMSLRNSTVGPGFTFDNFESRDFPSPAPLSLDTVSASANGGPTVTNRAGARMTVRNAMTFGGDLRNFGKLEFLSADVPIVPGHALFQIPDGDLINEATGTLEFQWGGGPGRSRVETNQIINHGLITHDGRSVFTLVAGSVDNTGTLETHGMFPFTVQNASLIQLNDATAPVFDNSGTLLLRAGQTVIQGTVVNSGQILFSGDVPLATDTLTVTDLQQTSAGTMNVQLQGNGTPASGITAGSVTLAGTLDFVLRNAASADPVQYSLLQYANRSGEFDTINSNGLSVTPDYGDTAMLLTLMEVAPGTVPASIAVSPPWQGEHSAESKGPAGLSTESVQHEPVQQQLHPSPASGTAAAAIAAATGIQTFTYDSVFNVLTSSTNTTGKQTVFEIDPATGNRLSMTVVIGQPDASSGETDDVTTRFTYTALGLVDTITDPLGRVTDMDYDNLGRLVQLTVAVGTASEAVRTMEYDAAGNVIAETDPIGQRTEFEYDSLNRLTRRIDPDPDGPTLPLTPSSTRYTYDPAGNLIRRELPSDSVTRYVRDEMGQVVRQIDEAGNQTTIDYDGVGNMVAITDPLQQTTRFEYDGRSQLTDRIDADGGRTMFAYDANGNLTQLTDAGGNTTRYAYDAQNRLQQVTDAVGEITTYEYDDGDRLIRRTDRNARTSEFVYDDFNRPTTITWLDSGQSVVNTLQYTYDTVGNLTTAVDDNSSVAFTYDDRNRIVTAETAGPSGSPSVLLTYTYDNAGNVLSVTDAVDGQAGAVTGYEYDSLNRLTRITQTANGLAAVADKRVDLDYNSLGQITEIMRFSDLTGSQPVAQSSFGFDQLNRLTDLTHSSATGEIAFYEYEYDADNRISQITDIDGLTEYQYDDLDQLTAASHSSAANPDENYSYDDTGNRVSSHLHDDSYQTGQANELLADGRFTYDYDAEGNLTQKTDTTTGTQRSFSYDHRNRLVRIRDTDSGGTDILNVHYQYDLLNRRISKSVQDASTEAAAYYSYYGNNVILEFADPDGMAGADPAVLSKRYLHGPDLDQVLAEESANGAVAWLLADHLGTIRDVISETGDVLNHRIYDSFGNIIAESDPTASTRYAFTGREYDAEVDLYFYRSRYYDSQTGRFISRDPIGFAAGSTNLYAYVGNRVTAFTDPMGLNPSFPGQNLSTEACPLAFDPEDAATQTCYDVSPDNPNALEFGPGNQLLEEGMTPRRRSTARRCGGFPDDPRGPTGECVPRPDSPEFEHLPPFDCDTTFEAPPDVTTRELDAGGPITGGLLIEISQAICDTFGDDLLNTCRGIDPDVYDDRTDTCRGSYCGASGVRG